MCCHENQDVIDECNDLFDENGEAIFYKIVRFYISRHMAHNEISVESMIGRYVWKPGVHEAIRESEKYDVDKPQGFHVFLTKKESNVQLGVHLKHAYGNIHIIKVVCKKEHLITAGYNSFYYTGGEPQAVFSQVTIIQEEWDECIKSHRLAKK
ncbi:MAG: hypothetical protein QQN41_14100, partial [Nitrosopumilus sp.]